jgi:hypothetical protein
VDTGIHALGWSRSKAIAFFEENAILATDNVVNEVDRYIAWPGQALAYKMGEREIRSLRADAEKRLGPKFDVKAFHDLLLSGGAVSLPVLREQVDAWIAAASPPPSTPTANAAGSREGSGTLPGFPTKSRGGVASSARREPSREGPGTLPGFPTK